MDPLSPARLHAVAELWKRTGRAIEARFTGSSMEPAIPSGSRLRLRCGAPVATGDVAAFVHEGRVFVHRVLAVAPPFLLARGDALVVPDPPLPLERVFARVEEIQRNGAWTAPTNHRESRPQRLTRMACAFRSNPAWTRVLVAALRRFRRRREPPVELLE